MSKKLYIYENAECDVTSNYHGGGGVVIITEDDPQKAWEALGNSGNLGDPDRVVTVPDSEVDSVIIFPDAGCC